MPFGAQSHALIVSAKLKGWNPTVIAGTNADISAFDVDPALDPIGHVTVGNLPGGSPDGWPDGYSMGRQFKASDPVPWNAPDTSRENANRRTINGAPAPASPGIRERSRERRIGR